MEAVDIHNHYRMIDPVDSDEYFELYDQLRFENSFKSLDSMVEDGETTMMS